MLVRCCPWQNWFELAKATSTFVQIHVKKHHFLYILTQSCEKRSEGALSSGYLSSFGLWKQRYTHLAMWRIPNPKIICVCHSLWVLKINVTVQSSHHSCKGDRKCTAVKHEADCVLDQTWKSNWDQAVKSCQGAFISFRAVKCFKRNFCKMLESVEGSQMFPDERWSLAHRCVLVSFFCHSRGKGSST